MSESSYDICWGNGGSVVCCLLPDVAPLIVGCLHMQHANLQLLYLCAVKLALSPTVHGMYMTLRHAYDLSWENEVGIQVKVKDSMQIANHAPFATLADRAEAQAQQFSAYQNEQDIAQ